MDADNISLNFFISTLFDGNFHLLYSKTESRDLIG